MRRGGQCESSTTYTSIDVVAAQQFLWKALTENVPLESLARKSSCRGLKSIFFLAGFSPKGHLPEDRYIKITLESFQPEKGVYQKTDRY